ncbi:MAG: hypothetical protein A2275_16630 [Bacteroidetes bacterium RIFOXYA12_FULL_35_11]|nr:MAG: hypothetical protein A2X01_11945 [Bacteroidetes bacterium GWF2_35_48]OFY72381.1 MAG: hypothetical protein A2275_16630 [Bacteroidetes bacterium RIFOXYA12_FULL_35_11]OFY96295.1 MAG: hypothetical protein A2309_12990 [Bacteroidetes bacterium RIFOXYB2_FULL_35_7]OFZ05886.1 MAG: hypothetical protein A2491_18500 [Bacteroidetes bacterium RIFOXYC12_FULL_35_7]HBX49523.1 hypothetical protein [Bacteroidales bacterium]
MKIKGTAVRSINDFIRKRFPEEYEKWISSLPESSRYIFQNPIFVTNWYPLNEACIIPTETAAKLFFENDVIKAGYESGKYSAESALNGIYKIFIKVSSPNFIIKRAGIVFGSYFEPSNITVVENLSKSAVVHISNFPEMNIVVEQRIHGWMFQAITMAGAKNLKIGITQSLTKGNEVTEYIINWD